MARIFFNPKTGEIWKSNKYLRKPPEGYQPTEIDIDYRYTRRYIIETVYCPECKEYHYWGASGRTTLPLSIQCQFKLIEEKGCSYAEKIFKNSYFRYLKTRKDYERYIALCNHIDLETFEKINAEIYKLGLSYKEEEKIGQAILSLLARNYLQKKGKE